MQKLFVLLFLLLNLVLPFVVEEVFPVTTAPMFRDNPHQYCEFTVFGPEGESLELEPFGLHRVYDGNPAGYGSGRLAAPSLDRFGIVDSPEVDWEAVLRLKPIPVDQAADPQPGTGPAIEPRDDPPETDRPAVVPTRQEIRDWVGPRLSALNLPWVRIQVQEIGPVGNAVAVQHVWEVVVVSQGDVGANAQGDQDPSPAADKEADPTEQNLNETLDTDNGPLSTTSQQ